MSRSEANRELRDDETTLIDTSVDIGEGPPLSDKEVNTILQRTQREDLAPATGIAKGIVAGLVLWLLIVSAFILLL
jgi:hypothetical protein